MKHLLLLCLAQFAFLHLQAQLVTTQFGQVQGSNNGTVKQFLGIPYAKPPVDDLRWKAPENPDAWAGVLNTTDFSPVCPQKKFEQGGTGDTIIGEEDCLYLNVWTPNIGAGTRPIMVFIHGGGNQQGSASEENGGAQMFFGKNISERGNAVVITIQYRLGPLGFLVHPGLDEESTTGTSGNFAVLDQLLALRWVKNNGHLFGGDTSKVMIFGESAGGINVGNLLSTSLGAGLFDRACIQSAAPTVSPYTTVETNGINYVNAYISSGTDAQKIAHMRTVSSDSLVMNETSPLAGGAVQLSWQPVIDNVVFTQTPQQQFETGNFNHVPLIIGSNSEESSLSAPQTVVPAMVTALINSTVPSGLQSEALALYPPGSNNTEARESFVGILTDGQFTATTRRTARCISNNQDEPVYRYFFTHKHTVSMLEALGSYHGMELFYVFNTWEDATLGSGPFFGEEDDSVQQHMLNYWVNFANTGNPNGAGLVSWPEYESVSDCYLEIKATPNGTQCGLRTQKSDLWDEAINYTGCGALATNELENELNLVIFPNPASNVIQISGIPLNENASFEVYSAIGEQLISGKLQNEISIADLATGMYFIRIHSNHQLATLSFVKE